MAPVDLESPEQSVLRARAQGDLSCEEAFDQLYALYEPVVRGWFLMSVNRAEADDLCQDVWVVFFRRWVEWRFLPEMAEPDARPVASFLYRTFRFVIEAHRRSTARKPERLDGLEVSQGPGEANKLLQQIDVGNCLHLAREVCSTKEMDVLLAKLADIPAREIAKTLLITESAVDHCFRRAVMRLQKRIKSANRRERLRKDA